MSSPIQLRPAILRTAVGSAPSVSQIRLFQSRGLRVVAVDCDPLSVGFVFADAAYAVPRATSPDYVDCLLEVCRKERVDWVLPALDEELALLASARDRFESIGTRILLSSLPALRICTDKLETNRFLVDHGIPTPLTFDAEELPARSVIYSYPQVVKPRFGRGSSGLHLARDWEQIEFFRRIEAPAVVQAWVEGCEFTVDVLCDFSSHAAIIAPRRRLATESGISYKGTNTWHEQIVHWVAVLVKELGIVGPANIQCFLTPGGQVLFTEINARLAGSCILSIMAGVPLVEGILALMRNAPPPVYLHPAPERIMLRYWSEVYLTPAEADGLCLPTGSHQFSLV